MGRGMLREVLAEVEDMLGGRGRLLEARGCPKGLQGWCPGAPGHAWTWARWGCCAGRPGCSMTQSARALFGGPGPEGMSVPTARSGTRSCGALGARCTTGSPCMRQGTERLRLAWCAGHS
eukprot:1157372-Pelagomonas_calceolata.AAC.4